MPSDARAKFAAQLGPALKALAKEPFQFAFGTDGAEGLLSLHKTKAGPALATQLKTECKFKKTCHGKATANGKVLVLDVGEKPPSGLRKQTLALFREHKLSRFTEVKILLGGVEQAGDGEAPAAPAASTSPAGPNEPVAASVSVAAVASVAAAYPPEPEPARRAVTKAENAALAKLPPEKLAGTNLTQRNPKELFTDRYMDELVKTKMAGANNSSLKDIMRKLAKGVSPGERMQLIASLAVIRGVDAAKLDADYDRFMVLRTQQDAVRSSKNGEVVPDLAEDFHDDFMGSQPQLLFGKVVGDAFGIDAVFGALLSPTGGMVGPGNQALHLDDDSPTGFHGIVHDAAGYLFNYHNQGPGYDYLGTEQAQGHATSDPMTGQQSGMRYWHEKLDPGKGTVALTGVIDSYYFVRDAKNSALESASAMRSGAAKSIEQAKVSAERNLAEARQEVGDAFESAMDSATTKAAAAKTSLEKAAQEAAAAAKAAKERVAASATEKLENAKSAIGNVREEAGAKMQAAWDYIWS